MTELSAVCDNDCDKDGVGDVVVVGKCERSLQPCSHVPTPKFGPLKFNIVLMVMGTLTARMGSTPILPIEVPITIDTLLKLLMGRIKT